MKLRRFSSASILRYSVGFPLSASRARAFKDFSDMLNRQFGPRGASCWNPAAIAAAMNCPLVM
jgi:hypothetical protein